jgi:protein TonB
MTLPTPLRSVLRSRLVAAPVRRASEQVRRRAAALIADLRVRGGAEVGAAWRARLATPAFWRPFGASVLLHAVALAGLVMLHRASLHTAEPPAIEVALTPSDPDARVGPQSGIAWGSEAEHTAIMALLEARRSAALLNEIVVTSAHKPPAPRRPSSASHTPSADPAPPAPAPAKALSRPVPERLTTPGGNPVVAALVSQSAPAPPLKSADAPVDPPSRPAELALPAAAPALAQVAPRPVEAQTDPLAVAEPVPAPVPPLEPVRAGLAAAPAPAPPAEATPAPPVQPAETPIEPPARPTEPPAAPQIATLATSTPADQGEKRYLQAVFERLRPIRDYPDLAKYHTSGRLQLAITVGRDGTVLDALVKHSSGYGFLDKAGLDLVRRASPLPALPTSFAKDSYTFEVPVSFRYD